MSAKRKPIAVKASESVVARMVAGLLGVPAHDYLSGVLESARDVHSFGFLSCDIHMYHWLADVPLQVMAEKAGPLVEHLASYPHGVFVVKDSVIAGSSGIWMATASEEMMHTLQGLPYRGLFNHFQIGYDVVKVTAVQLESCLRK